MRDRIKFDAATRSSSQKKVSRKKGNKGDAQLLQQNGELVDQNSGKNINPDGTSDRRGSQQAVDESRSFYLSDSEKEKILSKVPVPVLAWHADSFEDSENIDTAGAVTSSFSTGSRSAARSSRITDVSGKLFGPRILHGCRGGPRGSSPSSTRSGASSSSPTGGISSSTKEISLLVRIGMDATQALRVTGTLAQLFARPEDAVVGGRTRTEQLNMRNMKGNASQHSMTHASHSNLAPRAYHPSTMKNNKNKRITLFVYAAFLQQHPEIHELWLEQGFDLQPRGLREDPTSLHHLRGFQFASNNLLATQRVWTQIQMDAESYLHTGTKLSSSRAADPDCDLHLLPSRSVPSVPEPGLEVPHQHEELAARTRSTSSSSRVYYLPDEPLTGFLEPLLWDAGWTLVDKPVALTTSSSTLSPAEVLLLEVTGNSQAGGGTSLFVLDTERTPDAEGVAFSLISHPKFFASHVSLAVCAELAAEDAIESSLMWFSLSFTVLLCLLLFITAVLLTSTTRNTSGPGVLGATFGSSSSILGGFFRGIRGTKNVAATSTTSSILGRPPQQGYEQLGTSMRSFSSSSSSSSSAEHEGENQQEAHYENKNYDSSRSTGRHSSSRSSPVTSEGALEVQVLVSNRSAREVGPPPSGGYHCPSPFKVGKASSRTRGQERRDMNLGDHDQGIAGDRDGGEDDNFWKGGVHYVSVSYDVGHPSTT
ncbi:unnamed protein product [Amoebophrya sp. A25]|nr:unnamed protein product [Amoebophrya sp. A25]|eukprot:GSA25T00004064001.1